MLRETAPTTADDDEVDPLDAFMAGMAAEEPQRKPRPARLDEAARDAVDDDQYATKEGSNSKKAPAENRL